MTAVTNMQNLSSPFISDVLPSFSENVHFLNAQALINMMGVSSDQNNEILMNLDKANLLTDETYKQLEQNAHYLKEIFMVLSKASSLDKPYFDYAIKMGSERGRAPLAYYTTHSKLGTTHVPYIKV